MREMWFGFGLGGEGRLVRVLGVMLSLLLELELMLMLLCTHCDVDALRIYRAS